MRLSSDWTIGTYPAGKMSLSVPGTQTMPSGSAWELGGFSAAGFSTSTDVQVNITLNGPGGLAFNNPSGSGVSLMTSVSNGLVWRGVLTGTLAQINSMLGNVSSQVFNTSDAPKTGPEELDAEVLVDGTLPGGNPEEAVEAVPLWIQPPWTGAVGPFNVTEGTALTSSNGAIFLKGWMARRTE